MTGWTCPFCFEAGEFVSHDCRMMRALLDAFQVSTVAHSPLNGETSPPRGLRLVSPSTTNNTGERD
jgi:hypothetical protein